MAYCSKNKKTGIQSLPEEIVFIILLQLPADVLYYCSRFVCRQWYNIISSHHFIREHLCQSTSGLLSQYYRGGIPTFTTFNESNPVESTTSLPLGTDIYATFDGLAVVRFRDRFYVANLLTKQVVPLPPLNVRLDVNTSSCKFALARSQSVYVGYKVFVACRSHFSVPIQVMFITLGKDTAWVPIVSGGLVEYLRETMFPVRKAISIGTTVYWLFDFRDPVIALDAESGSCHRLLIPVLDHVWDRSIYSAGRAERPCVIVDEKEREGVFGFWFMADDHGRKSIPRVERIDVSMHLRRKNLSFTIVPAAWVNNGELLVFQKLFGGLLAYNVKTGKSFEFGDHVGYYCFTGDFVYSLVPLAPSLPC